MIIFLFKRVGFLQTIIPYAKNYLYQISGIVAWQKDPQILKKWGG
jgi:hypothetical protein